MSGSSIYQAAEEERMKTKKSLFNRPSWARTSSPSNLENKVEDDSFSRSSYMIEKLKKDRVENERKRERKLAKKNARKSRREEPDQRKSARAAKKRRMSNDLKNLEGTQENNESAESDGYDAQDVPRRERTAELVSETSPMKSRRIDNTTSEPDETPDVINICDDSDLELVAEQQHQPLDRPKTINLSKERSMPEDTVKYFSDEDLSDYTREDRLRRQKASQENPIDDSTMNGKHASGQSSAGELEKSQPDPVVKILITSRIPDTAPLLVHRKASQRLKEVRLSWCMKQDFDQEMVNSVFLTWRKRKIYDVTTCESLGVMQNAWGEVIIKGDNYGKYQRPPEAEDEETGALLHMEAMTNEIFEQDLKEREAARLKKFEDYEQPVPKPNPAPKDPGLRIILKANLPAFKDYKLQVKPTTKFEQIVNVFRSQRKVPEDKMVFLVFDGDKLNEEEMMMNSEVGDMDTIDVHIK